MKTSFLGITYASVQYAWLIILIMVLGYIVFFRLAKIKKVATALVGSHVSLLQNYSYPRHVLRVVLLMTALFCLWIALLRPQWNEKEQTVHHQGRDLLIALDISKSMLASDCNGSRLSAAKEKIKKLVRTLGSDRVGLILFSGMAFVHCPFTADYYAFDSFLDLVSVESFSTGTTALEVAVLEALRVFERTPDKKTRICAIFTDGEDFSSRLDSIKEQARHEQMRIVAVGVGTDYGAPIPDFDDHGVQKGHIVDGNGTIVISRLNESMLSQLVTDVGGYYVRMKEDVSDIDAIKWYVQSFEKETFEDKTVIQKEDQYPWFALMAFLALIFEWIL